MSSTSSSRLCWFDYHCLPKKKACLFVLVTSLTSTIASCPSSFDGYPSTSLSSLQELNGDWVDMYSSRLADTHFECTTQSNKFVNDTSYMTSTTCLLRDYLYELEVLNILFSSKDSMSVFDLVPVSESARWFAGSTFFLVDYLPDEYYSWMICNDSDEYEFHISSKTTSTDLTGVPEKVLSILASYGLNPQNYTFHEEPHNETKCPVKTVTAN